MCHDVAVHYWDTVSNAITGVKKKTFYQSGGIHCHQGLNPNVTGIKVKLFKNNL
jgi:hypothetical protein